MHKSDRPLAISALVLAALALLLILPRVLEREHRLPVERLECPQSPVRCQTLLDGEPWQLALLPATLPAMQTLSLSLRLPEYITLRQAYFEGADMDMGRHFLQKLEPVMPGQYQAQGMIPVCSVNQSMSWQLVLLVDDATGMRQIVWPLGPSSQEGS